MHALLSHTKNLEATERKKERETERIENNNNNECFEGASSKYKNCSKLNLCGFYESRCGLLCVRYAAERHANSLKHRDTHLPNHHHQVPS